MEPMDAERSSAFMLGDRAYDFLKKLVQIILPAFGTFYVTLGQVWGLPHGDEVAKTCLALAAFLGICLGISSNAYKASGAGFDGEIRVRPQVDGPTKVDFITKTPDPLDITNKSTARFKVTTETPLARAEVEPEEPEEEEPPRHRARKPRNTKPL